MVFKIKSIARYYAFYLQPYYIVKINIVLLNSKIIILFCLNIGTLSITINQSLERTSLWTRVHYALYDIYTSTTIREEIVNNFTHFYQIERDLERKSYISSGFRTFRDVYPTYTQVLRAGGLYISYMILI